MARLNIEAQTETMLKNSFVTALASDTITGVSMRRFWTSDTNAAFEEIALPAVVITAQPNFPSGYQSPLRKIPVSVTMITSEASDKKRTTLAGIYNAIRKDVDFGSFSDTNFANVEVWTVDGGTAGIEATDRGLVSKVDLQLEVEIAYAGAV